MTDYVEEPERLKPTPATARSLFLRSGNLCALPNCSEILLDDKGTFIGKMAHISAANRGGPRFIETMTNEQRRHENNLILVCAKHHDEIDQQPQDWTIAKLHAAKSVHEKRFSDVAAAILDSVRDWTDDHEIISTGKFDKYRASTGLDESEFKEVASEISATALRLRPLTRSARQVLTTIIKRGTFDRWSRSHWLHVGELERAMHLTPTQVMSILAELEKAKFARLDVVEETGDEPQATTQVGRDYGFLVSDLAEFCRAESIDVAEIIVSLRFDRLD